MMKYLCNLVIGFLLIGSVLTAIQEPNCTVDHNTAHYWTVDCSSLNLNYFPQHLLIHPVKKLIFINNNLNSTVTFNSWKNLEHLDVAFNKITHLTNKTFENLNNLIYLNISFNEIKSLKNDVFENLEILKVLDISGNQDLGLMTDELESTLSDCLFRGLRKLYVANLNLHHIKENFFDRANELTLLDLSNNYLTTLPIFPKSLKILDISNNSLITLSLHPFYYSRSIYTLISENNKNLSEIQTDAFHGLLDLKYVSFKGCTLLDNINYATFYFNQKIQYLSIAGCNFKTLPTVLRPIFLRIDVIDLQDNPWHCDAAIKWFIHMDIPVNMTKNLRCSTPDTRPLLEFYGPKAHHEMLKVLLGALVILVFIFFGVGLFYAYHMEKKRKLTHPYSPLGRGAPISSPVYFSTVV